MTAFLASLLVFLGASAALALGRARDRSAGGACGGCAARASGACTPRDPDPIERS